MAKTVAKTVSVRLPEQDAAEIEALAQFDGVAVAAEIREAVQMLIAARRTDSGFRKRVEETMKRAQRMLAEIDDDTAAVSDALEL